MECLDLDPDAPLVEMHVLTSEGRDIAGAEAVIFLAQRMWWAWPVVVLARLPGMHALLDRGYRWIAAHRGCGHIACDLKLPRLASRRFKETAFWRQLLLEVLPAWVALFALPVSVLPLRERIAPWQFMWLMAAAIFFGCKWLTAWRAQARTSEIKASRAFAYFFAWPGMDAEEFLFPSSQNLTALSSQVAPNAGRQEAPGDNAPWRREELPLVLGAQNHVAPLVAPIAKILLGTTLLFGIARFASPPLFTGWIGMIGMILILHFGLFQLLAIGWREAGIDVQPIMSAPLRSKTVSEFWGRRWNSAFNRLAFEFVSRPITRRLGGRSVSDAARGSRRTPTLRFAPAIATLTAFLVSGLIHELVISLPAGAGYGLPTAYFLLQGTGILAERAFPQIRGRSFTILIIAIPTFWLFHPPFVHNVILPFMRAIGAL